MHTQPFLLWMLLVWNHKYIREQDGYSILSLFVPYFEILMIFFYPGISMIITVKQACCHIVVKYFEICVITTVWYIWNLMNVFHIIFMLDSYWSDRYFIRSSLQQISVTYGWPIVMGDYLSIRLVLIAITYENQ